jgi:membrane-associated protease RseP (regulator of RpoE activity)
VATRVAATASSQSFGGGPDAVEANSWWRLGLVVAALALLGYANPWMLIVVLAVLLMITLHELGHYLTAKRAGMQVTEFFLGFGPKIWSTRRGETEYGLKAIPAGAYVKIPGMVNLDEVPPEIEPRTYRQKTFGQRLSVAVAGSAMHFLLAMVLIFIGLVFIGQPAGSIVSDSNLRPAIAETVIDGSGADDAGLQDGDQIIEVDGTDVPNARTLTETVRPLRGTTVPVTVLRDGEEVQTEVDLRAYEFEGTESCGLGIIMAPAEVEKTGALTAIVETPKQFGEIVWLSAKGLASFFSPSGISDFASQVGSAQEDADRAGADEQEQAPTGDPCSATAVPSSSGGGDGENRILSIYGLVRIGSDVGGVDPGALIGLFALINIFIGMFNLVPLLPFDGGHVAIAVYERVQEKRLRMGSRRYFTDVSRLLPLTYGVVGVLGLLFVTSLYLDIVNPIGG